MLRKQIVNYLTSHSTDAEAVPLELYVTRSWQDYVNEISTDGTYGDQAIFNVCNVTFSL